jgi:hypothetical protein
MLATWATVVLQGPGVADTWRKRSKQGGDVMALHHIWLLVLVGILVFSGCGPV